MTMTSTDDQDRSPVTWEEGCREAVYKVLGDELLGGEELTLPAESINEALMSGAIDAAVDLVHVTDVEPFVVVSCLRLLARQAWTAMLIGGYTVPTVDWVVDKLAEKQSNYGPGNILKFGVRGLVTRSSDKVERVKNMRAKGRSSNEESLFDSLFDLVGYAVIGQMLLDETFELPLARDMGQAVDEAAAAAEAKLDAWRNRLAREVPSVFHGTPAFDEAVLHAFEMFPDMSPDEIAVRFRVDP